MEIGVRPLPITFPLARNRVRQRCRRGLEVLLAIRDAAIVFAPRHFAGIGHEVRPGDMVMRADLSPAKAGEKAFSLVRASAFI